MNEVDLIQEIARRAELTLEAATRAYKAMQAIVSIQNENRVSLHSKAAQPSKQTPFTRVACQSASM